MTPRTQHILKAVIEEYIRKAEPISSEFLATHKEFSVSSATLRNELMALEEMSFLEKPHTSAGRVPTPAGYRFFVDNLLETPSVEAEKQKALKECQTFFQLEEFLARETGNVILGGENLDDIREAGLFGLLQEPEFTMRDFLLDFVKRVEKLHDEFDEVVEALPSQKSHLFIGEEAKPIVGDTRYSLLVTRVGENGFAMFFSPLRMHYGETLAFAEYLNILHT